MESVVSLSEGVVHPRPRGRPPGSSSSSGNSNWFDRTGGGAPNVPADAAAESAVGTIAIFFSSGDLGDVGRHAVAAALEVPGLNIVVLALNVQQALEEMPWKCACHDQSSIWRSSNNNSPARKRRSVSFSFSEHDKTRMTWISLDCTRDALAEHLHGVQAVISCLGNRQPFHKDTIAKVGTERILQAMQQVGISRLVLLSSVGISEDWPPMEWSREGDRLQGFFRTICWGQYQDLSGAELAVRQAQQTSDIDCLICRAVLLSETAQPLGRWYVQNRKHNDHPDSSLAKMDCARFMVQQCLHRTFSRRAVVVGDMPPEAA